MTLLLIERTQFPEGRIIIKDIESPAKSGDHQVVFALLDLHILDRIGGQRGSHFVPIRPTVPAGEKTKLGAGKEQVRIYVIFCEGIDRATDWQVGSNGRPCLSTVFRAEQIGLEVSVLVVVEGSV